MVLSWRVTAPAGWCFGAWLHPGGSLHSPAPCSQKGESLRNILVSEQALFCLVQPFFSPKSHVAPYVGKPGFSQHYWLYPCRFEIEYSTSLSRPLQALGIRKPFEGGDLTKVCGHMPSVPMHLTPCLTGLWYPPRWAAASTSMALSSILCLWQRARVCCAPPAGLPARRPSPPADESWPAAPRACDLVQIAAEAGGTAVTDLQVSDVVHKVYAKVGAGGRRRQWLGPCPQRWPASPIRPACADMGGFPLPAHGFRTNCRALWRCPRRRTRAGARSRHSGPTQQPGQQGGGSAVRLLLLPGLNALGSGGCWPADG